MCRLNRKSRGARHIPNGVSPLGYPFGMEQGAGIVSVQTLRPKIKRRSPLNGAETKALVNALKRHHLATV